MSEHEPEAQLPLPVDPPARLLWTAPRLTPFGAVTEITQGISYLPTDGISNLTP